MSDFFISPRYKKYSWGSEVEYERVVLTPSVNLYHKKMKNGIGFWIVLSFESMGGYAPKFYPWLYRGFIYGVFF